LILTDSKSHSPTHASQSAAPKEEDADSCIEHIPDLCWRATAKGYWQTGCSYAEFKATRISDDAQYGLVSALILTITVPLLLTKSGDYVEGRQGTWQQCVYLVGAMASTIFFLLCLSASVSNIIYVNLIPPEYIFHYIANPLPLYISGLPPPHYFLLGTLALLPTLSAGVYVFDGSSAMAWGTFAALTVVIAMSSWRNNNLVFLHLRYMKERNDRHSDRREAAPL
jgi:hypothetical protein